MGHKDSVWSLQHHAYLQGVLDPWILGMLGKWVDFCRLIMVNDG